MRLRGIRLKIALAAILLCSAPIRSDAAIGMLGWFAIGRVFDAVMAPSGKSSEAAPSPQEVSQYAAEANRMLPMELEGGWTAIVARASAPKTVEFTFVYSDARSSELNGDAIFSQWAPHLFQAACASGGYRSWIDRGGSFVFSFAGKDMIPVKSFWAEERDCQSVEAD